MKIIFIAIIVLIVLAIVALIIFKKLQANKGANLPHVSPANRLNNQQPTQPPINQATQIPPVVQPQATYPLGLADEHLLNQNYQEAIVELKRILMTNPRHHEAMLKLLQTYGITKQYDTFTQLHQKIHEIGDGETIREADFCKSLLAEELKQYQQPPAQVDTPISNEVLEFNLDDSPNAPLAAQPATPVKQDPSQEDMLEFDLGNLQETQPITEQQSLDLSDNLILDFSEEVQPTQEESLALDELALDDSSTLSQSDEILDLGELEFDVTNQEIPSTPEPLVLDGVLDIEAPADDPVLLDDISFELENTLPQDTKSDDSLEFDFSLDTNLSTTTQDTQHANDLALELDSTLELEDTLALDIAPVTPIEQTEIAQSSLETEFDFQLENTDSQIQQTQTSDNALEFTLADDDVQHSISPEDIKLTEDTLESIAIDDTQIDFELFDDTSATNTPTSDLDFVADKPTVGQTPISQDANTSSLDIASDDDFGFLLDKATHQETQHTTQTNNITNTNINANRLTPEELSFIKELDESQITLDLAKQYLSFGENDSAKHLLNEVIQTGNAEQQQHARELIERLE